MKTYIIILITLVACLAAAETNKTFHAAGGKYQFTMDTAVAPDLSDWANTELVPVVIEWSIRRLRGCWKFCK